MNKKEFVLQTAGLKQIQKLKIQRMPVKQKVKERESENKQ